MKDSSPCVELFRFSDNQFADKVCFEKNGCTLATVYTNKCVTVFLKQTLTKNSDI